LAKLAQINQLLPRIIVSLIIETHLSAGIDWYSLDTSGTAWLDHGWVELLLSQMWRHGCEADIGDPKEYDKLYGSFIKLRFYHILTQALRARKCFLRLQKMWRNYAALLQLFERQQGPLRLALVFAR